MTEQNMYFINIIIKKQVTTQSNNHTETLKMPFMRRYVEDLMDRSTWYPFACHTPCVMIKNCI